MADTKDDIVLSIRGMCKSFGRNRVLDHINLDVKRGTVMGLMGRKRRRKSTMMKCLFGTYQKDEGKIYLNGKEISFSGPKDALENGDCHGPPGAEPVPGAERHRQPVPWTLPHQFHGGRG